MEQEQIDFLRNLPGTVAEHVRQAVNEYIEKKRGLPASSQSRKEGNG